MEKVLPLKRGICPICKCRIMNIDCSQYNDKGTELKVLFTDNTKALFGICYSCKSTITKEQVEKILESQKVNWGLEIQKTLEWYVSEAINLKVGAWE